MRRSLIFIAPFIVVLMLIACRRSNPEAAALLARADSLLNPPPSTTARSQGADTSPAGGPQVALHLLDSVQHQARTAWPKADRMRYEVLLAEAMNKSYVPFTTDSVLKQVVRYYDRHGSPNEQLKAHYLLGCAYRDMGEAPAAINAWQEAVDCADTLSTDCDYNTLYRVYGQMADAFHNQLLFSDEITTLQKAIHYAHLAKDTLNNLFFQAKMGGAYILINKKDSAERILQNTLTIYEHHGYIQQSFVASLSLIYLYTHQQDRMDEAKLLMDRYEAFSKDFDEHHELHPSKRQYYRYKGLYFEHLGQLDSAEYYYRKIYRPGMDYVSKDPMYKGLLSVFTKRNQADSIAKYALLYGEANDSSIAIKDRELTAQVAGVYNYTRFQQSASEQRERALRNTYLLIIVSVAAFIFIAFAILLILWYRKRRIQGLKDLNQANKELTSAKEELKRNHFMLNNLTFIYHEALDTIKLLEGEKERTISKHQTSIAELERRFSESEKVLQATIKNQSTHIEVLEQRLGFSTCSEEKESVFSHPFITHVIEAAGKSNKELSQADWNRLMEILRGYYPKLSADLLANPQVTKQGMRVCLLTTLFLRGKDIANLFNVSSGRITNLKSDVNEAMFGKREAKALLPNLITFYHIQQPLETNNTAEV